MFAQALRAQPLRRTDAALARETRARPVAAAITVRGLSKAFGEKTVLSGLDLHVPAGQFVAIVGKSGCGKSTLLRLLVGLDRPSAGEVRVGEGAPVTRLMFQEPRLLPWARVGANVEVGLDPATPAAARTGLALEALREVGLADRAGEWPAVLSGGQKQRVALARALVSRPQLLALDEPLGALDALTRIEMQALVERVWQAQAFTGLLVTHDVAEAVALADRILVLEQGRVALDLMVDVPRPRRRGDPTLAALEGRILDSLLGGGGA
ncbi:Aliphatic sulfonates import ATP-binding protein SsuB [Methylobacterium crusticola]|uniref:Aliphatic sulfonates import ATP-binding protein SsuB n=1 Tax=Methylobacterium crusticola TaxID=1697972 RepID=A0ABQ4R299_9HYPH|nr:ATP-binding cassette domain-containing protein [Methylobacterium crusticola]GJD51401.1 Aliphatic sulfonates import ATP-binding protein SsuB [Methylobacterium crusticola]